MSDPLNSPSAKLTSGDVRSGLLKTFGGEATNGRSVVLFEVQNATGGRASRSADAVIMSCWPSDGLELHGVEIKVARSDWLNELRNPKKAEDIAQYCDRWWLVTTPGVVLDVAEIPAAWGWRVWDGKRLTTQQAAAKTEAKAVDRSFLASLLRNAGRLSEGAVNRAIRETREGLEAEVARQVKNCLEARTGDKVAALMKTVADFEAATGIQLHREETFGWLATEDGQRIGRMVAALKAAGLGGAAWDSSSLIGLLNHLEGAAAAVRQVGAEMGVMATAKSKRGRRG